MKKIYDYMPYVVLISVIIIDFIIFYALMVTLKVLEKEIVAAIIGFIGSVLGGIITLIGVHLTLKHRDREIFLASATEKLLAVEHLINNLRGHLNSSTIYEHSNLEQEKICNIIRLLTKSFNETLNENKNTVYKYLEFDEVRIIDFHQKTLSPILAKKVISVKEKEKCIDTIQSIFKVLIVSKENLENRYYKYKKKHGTF